MGEHLALVLNLPYAAGETQRKCRPSGAPTFAFPSWLVPQGGQDGISVVKRPLGLRRGWANGRGYKRLKTVWEIWKAAPAKAKASLAGHE